MRSPQRCVKYVNALVMFAYQHGHPEMGYDPVHEVAAEITRLRGWVNDLQSGMYVNCVYCGHRYGPKETTPVTMADALKAHVETCPHHPMAQRRGVEKAAERVREQWTSKHIVRTPLELAVVELIMAMSPPATEPPDAALARGEGKA